MKSSSSSEDDSSDSDTNVVQVADYSHLTTSSSSNTGAGKKRKYARRQFGAPTTLAQEEQTRRKQTQHHVSHKNQPHDPQEQDHLKNDIALQRLLSNHHQDLLSPPPPPPAGTTPMKIQKGINAKRKRTHQARLENAKNAGIVLAKSDTVTTKRKQRHNRKHGLKINSIGKFTSRGLVINPNQLKNT